MNWKRLNKAFEGSFKKFIFLSCNLASSLAVWTQSDILRNKGVKYSINVIYFIGEKGGGLRFWNFVDIKKAWWIMFWPWWQIDHVVSMWYCCTLIIWYGVAEDFFGTSKTIRKSVNGNTQKDGGPSTLGLETWRKREKLPWPFFFPLGPRHLLIRITLSVIKRWCLF